MAEHGRRWREIAAEDPDWVVLSLDRGKHGGWTDEELLATGRDAASALLDAATRHAGELGRELAVDVGCGVGRLTAALADRFNRVVGIDVTPLMLQRARTLVPAERVSFVLADITTEEVPGATEADLVITERVLQHLPPATLAPHLKALVGLLRPGGVAVVRVPVRLPWVVRLEPRRRLYDLLRRVGVPPRVLYWRLGLHPMPMHTVPPELVARAVAGVAEVVGIELQHEPAFGVDEAILVFRRNA